MPTMLSAIIATLMMKNVRAFITRRKKEPVRHPSVRNMKYSDVAKAASLRLHPSRSMRIFGAVVLVPTSMPTWHMIPMNDSSTTGLPSSLTMSAKRDARPSVLSSSGMAVMARNAAAATPITMYMGNSMRQPSPKLGIADIAPHMAMYGARNEAMALTNCPKVSVDARLPFMTIDTMGLSEVCMRVLPMPSSENDTSINPKLSPKSGSSSDSTVTASDSSTVFLRPILFISMPVGTLKMRNQKNTSEGNMLAVASLSPRSSFT